jgi:hypothetical protein
MFYIIFSDRASNVLPCLSLSTISATQLKHPSLHQKIRKIIKIEKVLGCSSLMLVLFRNDF